MFVKEIEPTKIFHRHYDSTKYDGSNAKIGEIKKFAISLYLSFFLILFFFFYSRFSENFRGNFTGKS